MQVSSVNILLYDMLIRKKFLSRFPCVDTVRLLLHCGAQVDITDRERNTPLHTLATTTPGFNPGPNKEEIIRKAEEIINILVSSGIHVDAVNMEGATAAKAASLRKFLINLRSLIIDLLL